MDASTDKSNMFAASNPVKLEEPQAPSAPVSNPAPAPTSAQPATGVASAGPNQPHHPVAEFLYQLTKMLTDDNNEIIEWVEGRIKVHFPERLETEVLHKYFRHSKFASFQRQLNYFGFRKIAGKGKMSPCSYVNESATSDIRSLLLIKRKTNGSAARKAMAQRALNLGGGMNPALGIGLPGLAGAPGFGALGAFPTVGHQLQLQKQLGLGLIDNSANNNVLSQLLIQNQQRQSLEDLQQLGGLKPAVPSIEQLQAQIANLTKQQNQGGLNPAFNVSALNLAAGGAATAAYSQLQQTVENPATAALNAAVGPTAAPAMPATAAMNISASGQSNNLFESATNLKALIGNDLTGNEQQKTLAPASALNNLIPNGASMGNLLASSNRLSSLLSLNSFLSREPSLADFAMIPNGAAQFAAFHQQQANIAAPTAALPFDANATHNANNAAS
eukprot:CAMPEP_0116134232 /NCGR_PEP_ID=MMETSP0329-20121206/10536_1 /TAXON_ID=697910 /ORGANISM="Pseudo-nitzschia arenysensis, Strain B593" /LENGTH=444 /DNA_ID=CAMNT_0003628929 /DNA_START=101 /DNA_END=1438 /DNA_ORIENTATION=+